MVELVAARGYEASTVAELCVPGGGLQADAVRALPGRQAALLPGDLRHHRAPRRDAHRDHGAVWLDVIAGAGPLERLRALVDVFAREVAAYPNAARLVLVEAPGVGPAALAHTSRTSRLVERAISQGLSEGATRPRLRGSRSNGS